MNINGVEVNVIGVPKITLGEIRKYIAYAQKHTYTPLTDLTIISEGSDNIELHYKAHSKFERIRRITGYLVGTLDRWNDAKKAEERARVKHY